MRSANELWQLSVRDLFERGRGVGSLLLAQAEAFVKRLRFSEVALDTAESAPQLVAFYVRRGYRSVSSVQWSGKTYRSIIMAKELRAGT